ncbi:MULTISPECIES: PadR family transcriptional regulator [Streptomyces]|uniref:DNA-binding PadR family transcriptional regulator/type II secretory pathway pseudopilin PulG n=1 Tax=Streptomyces stelliscabiei TaxID=146820 RepID=A0A8I0P647_9ACTN|nr:MULTISPECIES: PadR family transcriptional regulator [Streptomyces]KND27468.1 PadR family transcriptional regulator [Streptomyces stelliscabiei]MBE1600208.1 DNA-binding PadR family transcriptional regulator/type II secretory pathway pseudopilin PulG [Streptomyces stelliscabiei]MDX2515631.1 helix-turn-helix transcriptional regulator [Streptomyces stelliscabiei]MDX2549211.1 helix-turn-helix transcriptional regulator [Streptomyces stelliscabiei]MDX2611234.1 helix-turn-helix transcriptional regu
MPPVFAHGRLRLYLLKLLDEAPRHGYEVIRLLEERFQGLYAPSAGTVYPRLAKLEAEGLVTHTTEGGRKVYAITDAGRAELADRGGELADLELEIRESVAELAAEIRADVRGAAGDLRREMRAAASEARRGGGTGEGEQGTPGEFGGYADNASWRAAKEEMRRVKQEWKEQARRAKDESRRAREEAQRARRQAKEAQEHARTQAQEELQRIAKRVQDHVQDHFTRGDWPTGVREGLTELAKEFGEFGKDFGKEFGKDFGFGRTGAATGAGEPEYSATSEEFPAGYEPAWVHEPPTGEPARDLDRLLDRFRDDIRDAARDHGVTEEQLRDARRHLSTAAAHIGVVLRAPKG